ncbi:hypothetical protein ACTA71_008138 [Dictyostelium dimigraforme]
MINFKILIVLFIMFSIAKANHKLNIKNDSIKEGYFFYKFNEQYEFIPISEENFKEYKFKNQSINLPRGMDFNYLDDNLDSSIVEAIIIDNDSIINIIGIYKPIPTINSINIEQQLQQHQQSFGESFDFYKYNDKEKLFKNLKNGEKYDIDNKSLNSPYRKLEGFDNQWYDSDIGLDNSILLMKLTKSISASKSKSTSILKSTSSTSNVIYYNQNIILMYSKVEFCYSEFPEPTDFNPYFIVKRNRIDPLTKCSPPTGVVIALGCNPTPTPNCTNGLSLISFNDPKFYCPIYYCDLQMYYYYYL